MDLHELEALIDAVAQGRVAQEDAVRRLRRAPFTDMGYAKIDNHRGIRQGVAEVVYGEGKTTEQIIGICGAMLEGGQPRILVTRLSKKAAKALAKKVPLTYHKLCRIGIVGDMPTPTGNGTVVIAAAGTSDLPVAEEAALTAEVLGNQVIRLYDVGVAGIHRLLAHTDEILEANVIVAVAGMEGALPSVIAGMASAPVIAVPTSVGYGASLNGMAALLAMLNSCASGVSVVNIDNGFGGGYQASLINHARTGKAGHKGRAVHLDLTQDATRRHIYQDLLGRLDKEAQAAVERRLESAGIPDKHHHDLGEVLDTIDALVVSDRVKDDMRDIYSILAEAEAQVHGCKVGETHFHEVGNAASIKDSLGICLAIEALDPERITATAVQTGSGTVQCAHGLLDIPAPATAAILATGVPVCGERGEGELCTPTSAAVIKHFVEEFTL